MQTIMVLRNRKNTRKFKELKQKPLAIGNFLDKSFIRQNFRKRKETYWMSSLK